MTAMPTRPRLDIDGLLMLLTWLHPTMQRPRTRGDCANGMAENVPCPWVSCRHHMLIHNISKKGEITFNDPTGVLARGDTSMHGDDEITDADVERAIRSLPHSCSLDAAIMGRVHRERQPAEKKAAPVAETAEQLPLFEGAA